MIYPWDLIKTNKFNTKKKFLSHLEVKIIDNYCSNKRKKIYHVLTEKSNNSVNAIQIKLPSDE